MLAVEPIAGLFLVVLCATAEGRWLTLAGVGALFAAAVVGFGNVKSGFFPDSSTPLLFVDVWEPEGADIRSTRDDTLRVSNFIRQQPGVVQTTSVIGGPHQRFTLVYDAREPAPVYSQIIVRTETRDQIPAVWAATENFLREELPEIIGAYYRNCHVRSVGMPTQHRAQTIKSGFQRWSVETRCIVYFKLKT